MFVVPGKAGKLCGLGRSTARLPPKNAPRRAHDARLVQGTPHLWHNLLHDVRQPQPEGRATVAAVAALLLRVRASTACMKCLMLPGPKVPDSSPGATNDPHTMSHAEWVCTHGEALGSQFCESNGVCR
jgi:hypothetical protein